MHDPKEAHPAALLFPLMSADELQKLAEDIHTNGLIEPIALFEDRILDGRNRLKACEMAGVPPRYQEAALNGSSPTLYVASKNLHRRHLTLGQRAAIGAEMMPMLRAEARKRMSNGGKKHHGNQYQTEGTAKSPDLPNNPETNDLRGESRSIAARAVKAGGKTIQTAAAILAKDPELFQQVKRGQISVGEADTILKQKQKQKQQQQQQQQQAAPVRKAPALPHPGGSRRAALEKAETQRMVKGLARIGGMCRGLRLLKLELLALTAKDRAMWAKTCYEAARALQEFARQVKRPA